MMRLCLARRELIRGATIRERRQLCNVRLVMNRRWSLWRQEKIPLVVNFLSAAGVIVRSGGGANNDYIW